MASALSFSFNATLRVHSSALAGLPFYTYR